MEGLLGLRVTQHALDIHLQSLRCLRDPLEYATPLRLQNVKPGPWHTVGTSLYLFSK